MVTKSPGLQLILVPARQRGRAPSSPGQNYWSESGFSVEIAHVSREGGIKTRELQDTSAPQNCMVPKFKPNHRWSCVSSELSWVEVSRLFLDHGPRVEVSRTTFLVSKCLEIGAEVSQSVLMPKCPVTENARPDNAAPGTIT